MPSKGVGSSLLSRWLPAMLLCRPADCGTKYTRAVKLSLFQTQPLESWEHETAGCVSAREDLLALQRADRVAVVAAVAFAAKPEADLGPRCTAVRLLVLASVRSGVRSRCAAGGESRSALGA
jgi:hypothetical protein